MQHEEMITNGRYTARPSWLAYIPTSALPENAKAVWCQLANHLGENDTAWPSLESLTFSTGLSRKTVDGALDRLRELRLIESRRGQASNEYTLFAPRPLLLAEDDIARMQAYKPDGQRHDYAAYRSRAKQGLLEWRVELLNAGGPDLKTLGLKGATAAAASSHMATLGSSDMRTPSSSQMGTQTTPHTHSTEPLKVTTSPTPPASPVAGEGPAGPDGDQSHDELEEYAISPNSSTTVVASVARSAYSPTVPAPVPVHTAAPAAQAGDEQRDGAGPTPQATARPPAKPKRRRGGRQSKLDGTLDDALKAEDGSPFSNAQVTAKATASFKAMTEYLLYGADAIGVADKSAFKESKLSWRKFCTLDDAGKLVKPNAETWTAGAWAGFFWFKVSQYRSKRNQPLTLPAWSRLFGEVRNLLARRSPDQAYEYIAKLTQYFDLVLWMAGPAAPGLKLDETALSHPRVVATVDTIRGMSDEQIAAAFAAAQAGTSYMHYCNLPRARAWG